MYTWDTKWISQYESPWSIVNKFMFANSLLGSHAAREFTTMRPKSFSDNTKEMMIHSGVICNYFFNDSTWCIGNKTMIKYGSNIIDELLQPILSNNIIDNKKNIYNYLIFKYLRFCPECMKIGEHKIYHQFTFLDKCLIHNEKLLNTCPNCNNLLMYEIEFKNDRTSYQCKHCNYRLFNGDFADVIDIWQSSSRLNYKSSKPHQANIFSHLLLYYKFNNRNNSKEINNVLSSIYFDKKMKMKTEYSITRDNMDKCIPINSICEAPNDLKHLLYQYIYQEDLDKWSKINTQNLIDKVYSQAYFEITKQILMDFKITKEIINNANIYYDLNKTYKYKLNDEVLGDFIDKTFDVVALAFWIWKRDMEHNGQNSRFYYIDLNSYDKENIPIISSDASIIHFLEYIDKLFHGFVIDIKLSNMEKDNIKYTTMVSITKRIMYEKFIALCSYIKKLSHEKNKYDFLKIFDNIPYIEANIFDLFILLIDKDTKQYYLYTD